MVTHQKRNSGINGSARNHILYLEELSLSKITTLCYIRNRGRVLMLFRNKKDHDENEGKWIGVGGKLECGESPDECMLREVREETGLTLTSYRFRGVISFISDVWDDEYMMLYDAVSFEGILRKDCPEGMLKWIPEEEVMSLRLWEGDRLFLDKLLHSEGPIHMKLTYQGEALKQWVDYGCGLQGPSELLQPY